MTRPPDIVPPTRIMVRPTPDRGLGVFATVPIAEGELIERATVIVVPRDEAAASRILSAYCFEWDEQHVALAMGCGSLYNHSYEPNAEYADEDAVRCKTFTALRDIAAGEEITINYNGDPDDADDVGFEVR